MLADIAPLQPLEAIRAGYADARRAGAARHRDIAAQLGVSEGEMIAAHVAAVPPPDGLYARRLAGPWPALVASLQSCGDVMALTRNPSCVHEKTGTYRDCSAAGPAGREMGLALGEIDLRIFYSRWMHGFAVDEAGAQGVQRSLQFFDAQGQAVHKVFTRRATDREAWVELVLRFLCPDTTPGIRPRAAEAAPEEMPDDSVDLGAFRKSWASMRDTHEFFGLLKKHGLTRTQALRLAEPRFVQAVDVHSAQQLLSGAAAAGTPIMVFVGNPGMIQIHSGTVKKVVVTGPWLNVLDERFNLHLREDHVASAFVVRKPTVDGLVTSVEIFDTRGETIAMFFGERKPGRPERCEWRTLVDALSGDQAPLLSCAP